MVEPRSWLGYCRGSAAWASSYEWTGPGVRPTGPMGGNEET